MEFTDWQYFGTISFIQSIMNKREVLFDQNEAFSKMSFKNRTIITTAQGPLTLTIPILGGRSQKTPMKDVKIAFDAPWHKQHLKAIKTSYQRAPFFEYYETSIQSLYEHPSENLVDFLLACQHWVKKQLKGEWTINDALYNENSSMTALQKDKEFWLPNNYQKVNNPIIYQQVFQDQVGFIPNTSFLDIIFCCGGKTSKQLLAAHSIVK